MMKRSIILWFAVIAALSPVYTCLADTLEEKLFAALWAGDESQIKAYIKAGADLNQVKKLNKTPLTWAAEEGNKRLVRLLVGKGANINLVDGWGYSPLICAIDSGDSDLVILIVQLGAHVEQKITINLVRSETRIITPLMEAVTSEKVTMVKVLLRAGADCNHIIEKQASPLTAAIRLENKKIVKELLRAGADINLKDGQRETPVEVALEVENVEIAELFLKEAHVDLSDLRKKLKNQ